MDHEPASAPATAQSDPREKDNGDVAHPPKMELLTQHSITQLGDAARSPVSPASPVFFCSAQWTADGTTILTSSSNHCVSSFVLPSDLLQNDKPGRPLQPQATTKLPEPTQTAALAPFFSLAEPASQTFLVGCRDHPLHLYHAFPESPSPSPGEPSPGGPIAQYKLIRHETEQYITPSSLVWPSPGTHFVCGSANRIDYFDVSRHGSDGPVLTVPTIPSKRHISKGHGVGMKGTVSALAISPSDSNGGSLVAAGTRTRWMGLYDLHRSDGAVANWKISQSDLPGPTGMSSGQGIVQLLWSPCGRYLIINERHSNGLLIYDIRGSGRLLGVLNGRQSNTQQKLLCDVFQGDPHSEGGFEVWAGAQDGSVTVWENVGLTAAEIEPSWTWKPHSSPVCSTILHPGGSVVATCSGGWEHLAINEHDDDTEATPENSHQPQNCKVLNESSLKLWSLQNGNVEFDQNT